MLSRISVLFSKIVFCTILLSFFTSCDNNDDKVGTGPVVNFEHDGLVNHHISRLYQHNDQLFAATDQGLYIKATTDSEWQPAGLSTMQVLDVAIIDGDHYIASVRETDDETINDQLMETTDGGDSWQPVEHDFGGETTETIYAFYYDEVNNALYATGVDALAVSYDEGRSWALLNGMWGAFGQPKHVVKHNPATNEIWYGGQNAIEQMVLVRYSLDTGEAQEFPELLPSPAVIHGIQFDPENDQGVYVSGEGGVLKTDNNGEDWRTLIGDVDYRFYFDIALDPSDPETLYTAGWDKGVEEPQPLILEISTNDGSSWTNYRPDTDSATPWGGVRSVLATTESGLTVVYLGLYENGIVKATVL